MIITLANVNAHLTHAQKPFFMGLGDLPGGDYNSYAWNVSADGGVVVGISVANQGTDHFRWTPDTGMVGLGIINGFSPNVSADGSTIVGGQVMRPCPGCNGEKYRWTSVTGFVPIPLSAGHWLSTSGDGSIVAGTAFNQATNEFQAALWTEAGGVEFVPVASEDITDISADGSVIVGRQIPGTRYIPYIWSAAEGFVSIDLPSRYADDGTDLKISDNGTVVTGNVVTSCCPYSDDLRGFRWTKETGAVDVGRLPDGPWMSANGVSADGSVIVGNSVNVNPQRPAIWDAAHGPHYLDDLLINELGLGGALAGWSGLHTDGLSGDGRTVIGRGTNPDGNTEGWIAFLGSQPVPEPSAATLFAGGSLVLLAARRRKCLH
jgi:uncharacterized membrane protein